MDYTVDSFLELRNTDSLTDAVLRLILAALTGKEIIMGNQTVTIDLGGLQERIGNLDSATATDPDASNNLNQLLKGLLKKQTGTNTPGLIVANTAGTISGVKSVTLEVIGADATILGQAVADGYTLRWEAEPGKTLANLAYNPGTGTIIIQTVS